MHLRRLAGVGAFLSRESAAQRNAAVVGLQALKGSLCTSRFQAVSVKHVGRAALGVKKEFSFTLVCMTCLRTLLVMLMKIVKILSDLVGPAASHEDQELLSYIKIHSYYLKHTL